MLGTTDMAFLQLLLNLNIFVCTTNSFNLEKSRPIIYRVPGTGERSSSYFGMSVAIRPKAGTTNDSWSVQVGAPRGHAGSEGVPGPGTAYRCHVYGPCRAFAPDEEFGAFGGHDASEFREKKDAAWIGVAMDVSLFGSGERSVVCGHRWMNQNLKNPENIDVTYLVTGVCYLQDILGGTFQTSARRLLPLLSKGLLLFEVAIRKAEIDKIYTPKPYVVDLSTYHWGLGQAGISVKSTEDPWQLLVGAPGVTHWVGSVIRYDQHLRPTVANFARTEIARRSRYPYLGYSVASGRFYKDGELWYVAGAPRSANYRGQVFTFRFKGPTDDVNVQSNFVGATFGEYFGSSLATADLNGDGYDDLIVGAPLFSNKYPDEGRIYVFLGTGRGDFLVPAQIISGSVGQSRFGSCISSIKDLDQDGYDDVAVGAPYEDNNNGAVYIYRGFPKGLHTEHSQHIRAQDIHPHLRGFGISISPGVDVDGNKYLDIAVGSYLSGHVVLLRSRPVISLHPKIRTGNVSLIDRRDSHFNVSVCSGYAGANAPDYVDIVRTVDVDSLHGRGRLDPKSEHRKIIRLRRNQLICETESILLNTSRNNFSPLQITVRNEVHLCLTGKGSALLIEGEEAKETEEFPKNCPVGNKAETSKDIAFAGVCGSDLTCRSDLELSCAVPGFRAGSYTLGSVEFLGLSMEVKNHGEPAYETKIKIWSNLKLKRRDHETQSEASGKTFWLYHDGIVTDNYKANFTFLIDFEALPGSEEDTHLNLVVEIFTSSMEMNLKNNNCKFSVKLQSETLLNFYASSSAASAYIPKRPPTGQTLNLTHYYEVQRTGVTPLKDAELTVYIPYYFKTEFLTFEVETAEWMHFSHHSEKSSSTGLHHRGPDEANPKGNCPPTNRTLFLNCSTAGTECDVLKIFFTKGIPAGFSSYVKILLTLNVSAIESVQMEKDIVYLSTVAVLKFSKFLEKQPAEVRRSASTSLYDEEREWRVEAHVVALSILAGGFLLSLIVTGLVKSNFFKRSKKQELKALRDADASFVYFATGENFQAT